jgi:regulator of replication initiation timing
MAASPATAKVSAGVEFDAIERLEDKVRKLVGVVEQLRAEHGRLSTENRHLSDENGALRKKLVDSEGTAAEISVLREERDQIRARVSDMLSQLEALDV